MSDVNPLISNGTCYYATGLRSEGSYLPCGNSALGHASCCSAGDMCLSFNACFNSRWGVTYLAGCTDRNYQDPSCPHKDDENGTTFCKALQKTLT
ncbi:hypothetical protein B0T16DRAFT_334981 [Cercophora newfieldiana]|uniref:Uncharacterized protein n=1 Tax=Cercophora newfieldiana TaxID=92897 RepID=A0AA39XXE2_9PEZI|nr:hypothetical protein B0T16DRAFT_334981 [Cercophora newfieldiana]